MDSKKHTHICICKAEWVSVRELMLASFSHVPKRCTGQLNERCAWNNFQETADKGIFAM